ncbi:MAG: helix-turn-helix domain-containing protein [Kiritimatiellia bacterium]
MRRQYRYFPHLERLEQWGITITCAGYATAGANCEFPSRAHPDGYYFEYARGRRLNEYQLVYIDRGEGVAQFGSRRYEIRPGSLMVLMPNAWHRYRPSRDTGWSSAWLGFRGAIADKLFSPQYFARTGEVLDLSDLPSFRVRFHELVDEFVTSNDTRLFSLCGRIPEIVAILIEHDLKQSGVLTHAEKMVKAQRLIIDNYNRAVDFPALSEQLEIPYRTFRYQFAKETGRSPLQYQLQIRLKYAKNLLCSSEIPVSEIARLIGFKSLWHFSHFFARNCGASPSDYRKSHKPSFDN